MNPTDATLPRILLVEDDPVSRAFLAAAIERCRPTSIVADTLRAALQLARRT